MFDPADIEAKLAKATETRKALAEAGDATGFAKALVREELWRQRLEEFRVAEPRSKVDFKPELHPRDRRGKFVDVLGKLGGESKSKIIARPPLDPSKLRGGARPPLGKGDEGPRKPRSAATRRLQQRAQDRHREIEAKRVQGEEEAIRRGRAAHPKPGTEEYDRAVRGYLGGKGDEGSRKLSRAEKDAAAAKAYPKGSKVTTTVHGIGGRADKVTGEVVDHKFGQLRVRTKNHGTIVVPLDKVEKPGPTVRPARPGHYGAGEKNVGKRVRIAGSIYTGEIVGWDGSENYRVRIDRGEGADPSLAGSQRTSIYRHDKLEMIDAPPSDSYGRVKGKGDEGWQKDKGDLASPAPPPGYKFAKSIISRDDGANVKTYRKGMSDKLIWVEKDGAGGWGRTEAAARAVMAEDAKSDKGVPTKPDIEKAKKKIKREVMARFGGDLMGPALKGVEVSDEDAKRYLNGATIDDLLPGGGGKGDEGPPQGPVRGYDDGGRLAPGTWAQFDDALFGTVMPPDKDTPAKHYKVVSSDNQTHHVPFKDYKKPMERLGLAGKGDEGPSAVDLLKAPRSPEGPLRKWPRDLSPEEERQAAAIARDRDATPEDWAELAKGVAKEANEDRDAQREQFDPADWDVARSEGFTRLDVGDYFARNNSVYRKINRHEGIGIHGIDKGSRVAHAGNVVKLKRKRG